MDILINDIPEEGLDIEADDGDVWLAGLLSDTLGNKFQKSGATVKISIMRYDDNLDLQGSVHFSSLNECDRCLVEFKHESHVRIHTILIPISERNERLSADEMEEIELSSEDLEFGYYEGDRFDLAEVVREQILLAEPMKHLCKEDCKGLCQRCGKNLNEGVCECKEEQVDPRWAALKDVKISPKNH